jgi:hypothetical protein
LATLLGQQGRVHAHSHGATIQAGIDTDKNPHFLLRFLVLPRVDIAVLYINPATVFSGKNSTRATGSLKSSKT